MSSSRRASSSITRRLLDAKEERMASKRRGRPPYSLRRSRSATAAGSLYASTSTWRSSTVCTARAERPLPSGPKSDMARASSPSLRPPLPSSGAPNNGALTDVANLGSARTTSSKNSISTGSGGDTRSGSNPSRQLSGGADPGEYASPSCALISVSVNFSRIPRNISRIATTPNLSPLRIALALTTARASTPSTSSNATSTRTFFKSSARLVRARNVTAPLGAHAATVRSVSSVHRLPVDLSTFAHIASAVARCFLARMNLATSSVASHAA